MTHRETHTYKNVEGSMKLIVWLDGPVSDFWIVFSGFLTVLYCKYLVS